MDLEHFMDIFLALLSNQEPNFCPPDDKDEKVLDFWRSLISMLVLLLCIFTDTLWPSRLGDSDKELWPSFSTTLDVALSSQPQTGLKKQFLVERLGIGLDLEGLCIESFSSFTAIFRPSNFVRSALINYTSFYITTQEILYQMHLFLSLPRLVSSWSRQYDVTKVLITNVWWVSLVVLFNSRKRQTRNQLIATAVPRRSIHNI